MKIGSLVVCINNAGAEAFLTLNTIYTVREIIIGGQMSKDGRRYIDNEAVAAYLEEVVAPFDRGIEMPIKGSRLREILPPIANIEEHINENTIEPELA